MFYQTKPIKSNRPILTMGAITLFALALVVSSPFAFANTSDNKTSTQQVDHSKMAGMSGMKDMGGMKHTQGMSMTDDVDYDFAVNMRRHHQMAINMSQMELKNGKNPKLLTLATNIITAQKKEIVMLDAWVAEHKKATIKPKPY